MREPLVWLLLLLGLLMATLALAENIAPLELGFQRIEGDSLADRVNLSLRITQVISNLVENALKNLIERAAWKRLHRFWKVLQSCQLGIGAGLALESDQEWIHFA